MATTVEGLDLLVRRLLAMPEATRVEISTAIAKGADEMVNMAQGLAPVSPGGGALRDSIEWKWSGAVGSEGLGVSTENRVGLKGAVELSATVTAGNKKAFYARWVEHGTRLTPAQPFFWPSWRALRKRIKGRITRAQNAAIKKALTK